MNAPAPTSPTYTLRPPGAASGRYARDVARLADEVLAAGEALRPVVERYRAFVVETGREPPRTHGEYLLEALVLGVLWRARGGDATRSGPMATFVDRLAAHRRAGGAKPRDGSRSWILSLDAGFRPGHPSPTLADLDRLLAWLLASGEYDDEVARLDGWRAFLAAAPAALAEDDLEDAVLFATAFEGWSEHALGLYTSRVPGYLRDALPRRRWREDALQCSRRRVEYHLAMVGAEILNRAWRPAFLARSRHVVVMPGCMRREDDEACRAERSALDLRCTGCAAGCAVRAATAVARRSGAEAVAVLHGSDFSRFLRSPALAGGDVGIVGVACVPGLLGAGWRAYATGLPAQCVLLEASGCEHWRDAPVPTSIDLGALRSVLGDEVRLRMVPAAEAVCQG